MSTKHHAARLNGQAFIDVVTYLSWYLACFHTGES
jgi:hypothetical protein